jgi:hypothetical protein
VRVFKWLLVSTAVMSNAYANLDVLTNSMWEDPVQGHVAAIQHRGNLVKDAVIASSAAYNDKDLIAIKSKPLSQQRGFAERQSMIEDGHQVINFNAISKKHGHVPAGIVTYKEENGKGRLTIAYHGSESLQDFTEANLWAFKQKNDDLGINGYLHGGFNTRYMESRESLFDSIEQILTINGRSIQDVEILVTGHSLGGALAHLAAFDIQKNLVNAFNATSKVDLVTFSSPRVFDHKGAEQMENLLGNNRMIRIWRENDIVPAVSLGTPLLGGFIDGYKHVGQSVKLAANGWFGDLKNHSLQSIKEDAVSPNNVKIDQNHMGYREKISHQVSKIAKVPAAIGKYIKSWF